MITEKITQEQLKQWAEQYEQNPVNRVVELAVQGVGIDQAAQRPEAVKTHNFVFTHTCKQGEPTAQKQSGRCWYFAALNSIRGSVMEKLGCDNFEFSQTHLYFYDKLEKANTYLEQIIETIDKEMEDPELWQLLTTDACYDGGFWDYFKYLCLKYGLVPKQEGPETFQSQNSYMFTKQLDWRVKRAAAEMRAAYRSGESIEQLRERKNLVLADIYNICVKSLGRPTERFTYRYAGKSAKEPEKKETKAADQATKSEESSEESSKERVLPEMTAVEFFEKYVGVEELERRVTLVSDPRPEIPTGRMLEIKRVKNVYEYPAARGLNVPMEVLVDAAKASILDKEPMWFACDVGKFIDRKKGLLDADLFDYDAVLTPVGNFEKADRFRYHYSQATHAMNLTGVTLDEQGKPLFWKVENSWGEDLGKKGTFSMTQKWFEEYTYEVIVDKKYVPETYRQGLEQEPIELSIWNPLAQMLLGRFEQEI